MAIAFNIQTSSSLQNYRAIYYPAPGWTPPWSIHVNGPAEPAWWEPVSQRLDELTQLRPDWDGRRSPPLNPGDIVAAIRFLSEVMRADTPAPWIGPLSSGGVQLAWRHGDVEVEAVFDQSRGELELLVADGEDEREEPIDTAGPLFASVVDRLHAAELAT